MASGAGLCRLFLPMARRECTGRAEIPAIPEQLDAPPIRSIVFLPMRDLTPLFFTSDPVDCARGLVGATFVWKNCSGKIVETEAYRSHGDEACHTWFRPSSRLFMERHSPGDAYIYISYGVHWLFNILVKGDPAAQPAGNGFVLIRALEPASGIETMRSRRGISFPDNQLAAGPGRFTQALGISGEDHGFGFLKSKSCRIIPARNPPPIVAGPRIGISKATHLPWRFGIPDSRYLSKKF